MATSATSRTTPLGTKTVKGWERGVRPTNSGRREMASTSTKLNISSRILLLPILYLHRAQVRNRTSDQLRVRST